MSAITRSIFSGRMLAILGIGVSSGLPLLLAGGTLKGWMRQNGVDLSIIGFFGWVGLPYTLKFVWAPLIDRFPLPFLGRRRGWIFVSQIMVAVALVGLGFANSANNLWLTAAFAFLCTFFSATQDIAIDAYRRDVLEVKELGMGSSMAVNGYRIGLWIAGGIAFILADHIPWQSVYFVMAGLMLSFTVITLLSPEPVDQVAPPRNFKEAVVDPFADFFSRHGAWEILVFILLYKVGDSMASDMFTPFYKDMQFTNTEIGLAAKTVALWATLLGAFIGGLTIFKIGIMRALWIFGIFQAVSTALFAGLAHLGHNVPALVGVIAFENIASGMGTSAYTAYMTALCNKRFTATQFALLSSLAGVPRVFFGGWSGVIAENMGWATYFIFCALIALPGMLMLLRAKTWENRF